MSYVIQYNATLLICQFLTGVYFPVKSYLVGLWYKAGGKDPWLQHLHYLTRERSEDDRLDMLRNLRKLEITRIVYRVMTGANADSTDRLVTELNFAMTTSCIGYTLQPRLCKLVILFSYAKTGADLIEALKAYHNDPIRALKTKGFDDNWLKSFQESTFDQVDIADYMHHRGLTL